MGIKDKTEAAFKVFVAGSALIYTFYTVVDLTLFLSNPNVNRAVNNWNKDVQWVDICRILFVDELLLSIFLIVHSVLALTEVKEFIAARLKFQVLQRSLYVILTCLTLQFLMKNWQHVQKYELWNINTNEVELYWWFFITLHALAWIFIYVGTICMDINELLGIKQVYYNIQHLPDPSSYKSYELQRLYAHMRHPSFIGFCIILWAAPSMSLDRVLMAAIFTIYMFLGWNTDHNDCRYQWLQFIRKAHEFNHVD